jgi:hypothetical protein
MKKSLCIDFDGVIHSYTSGWQGVDVITDPPVPGALEWLRDMCEEFEVHIFSSRSHQDGGLRAIRGYLRVQLENMFGEEEGDRIMACLSFPEKKPPAVLYIDDRGWQFNGRNFPSAEQVHEFQPWYKRGKSDAAG